MFKASKGEKIFYIINIILMLIIAATTVYPFLHLLAVSLSGPGPVIKKEVNIIPKGFTLETYRQLITTDKMTKTMFNTLYITVVGTAIQMFMTILIAYPLSRKYILAKSIIMKMIIFTMLFNGGMIPNYILVRKLGMIDTYWALMIPRAISAFNMIVLMNFFRAIPDEMEESAKIDGAGDLRILIVIVLPLSLSSLATIALFYAVGKWNIFMPAVMYLNNMSKYPLQVMLRQIILLDESIGGSTDAVLQMPPDTKKAASIFFSVVPILCVYPFLQKYFVKGVMIGSIKG